MCAKAGELDSSRVVERGFEPEAGRGRRDIGGNQIFREHAEVRIARVSDGGTEINVAVSAGKPASGGRSATGVAGIFEVVLFAIGKRGERFHQRSHCNWPVGMLPARS